MAFSSYTAPSWGHPLGFQPDGLAGALITQLWAPAHVAPAAAVTVTWWPGSNDPLVIVAVRPGRSRHSAAGGPPHLPAALCGLGLDSFRAWDDDVLVVPCTQAATVRVIDHRLWLLVGSSCWGGGDLPPDPAWQHLGTCPVGVMAYEADGDRDDPAARFVDLLQQRQAVIADVAVVRRNARSQPRAAA